MFFYKFPSKFNCINHSGKKITMGIQRNKNVLYLKPIISQNTITGNWKPNNGNNSDFPLIALRKGILPLILGVKGKASFSERISSLWKCSTSLLQSIAWVYWWWISNYCRGHNKANLIDPVLSKVHQFVIAGWTEGCYDETLEPYHSRRGELSSKQDSVLLGCRFIIPPKCWGNCIGNPWYMWYEDNCSCIHVVAKTAPGNWKSS